MCIIHLYIQPHKNTKGEEEIWRVIGGVFQTISGLTLQCCFWIYSKAPRIIKKQEIFTLSCLEVQICCLLITDDRFPQNKQPSKTSRGQQGIGDRHSKAKERQLEKEAHELELQKWKRRRKPNSLSVLSNTWMPSRFPAEENTSVTQLSGIRPKVGSSLLVLQIKSVLEPRGKDEDCFSLWDTSHLMPFTCRFYACSNKPLKITLIHVAEG